MARIANRESGAHAALQIPFKGSNLCGAWRGDLYVVWSYNTPVVVHSRASRRWYQTKTKFSVTISRHQLQVCSRLDAASVEQDELEKALVDPAYQPLTELDKKGICVGDTVRVTHSSGLFIKGSLVRVEEYWSSYDRVKVSPVIAVRTERDNPYDHMDNVYVLHLRSVESVNDLAKES